MTHRSHLEAIGQIAKPIWDPIKKRLPPHGPLHAPATHHISALVVFFTGPLGGLPRVYDPSDGVASLSISGDILVGLHVLSSHQTQFTFCTKGHQQLLHKTCCRYDVATLVCSKKLPFLLQLQYAHSSFVFI
jgi:hypothetical protein